MASPRESLPAFCDLLPERTRPRPWQLAPFEGMVPGSVVVVVAGRGVGKSETLAKLATWQGFRLPEQRVLVISASEFASRRLLAAVRAACSCEALRGSVVDEQASLVRLSNGSEIRSFPRRSARSAATSPTCSSATRRP